MRIMQICKFVLFENSPWLFHLYYNIIIIGKQVMNFQQKVFQATQKIPKGKVATYSQIAKIIGRPRACRAVGNALNKNRDPKVPCHRVVKSSGKVGGFRDGAKTKIRKLKKEGVKIARGVVDLEKYQTKILRKIKLA